VKIKILVGLKNLFDLSGVLQKNLSAKFHRDGIRSAQVNKIIESLFRQRIFFLHYLNAEGTTFYHDFLASVSW
jgi:hypothetical protein